MENIQAENCSTIEKICTLILNYCSWLKLLFSLLEKLFRIDFLLSRVFVQSSEEKNYIVGVSLIVKYIGY